jgi:glucose-1-phosphate adenylyltransferase
MKTNCIGVIFSNAGDNMLRDLTERRCMGSVPFGGRYRMIDFPLSAMVHAGITKVGISTRNNYRSLMDHLGSGKPWDLSRKNGGIYLFPPYSNMVSGTNATRLLELSAMMPFLENSKEDYVVMCDCDAVFNFDLGKMIDSHIASGADITFGCIHGSKPRSGNGRMVFETKEGNRITNILIDPDTNESCDYCANLCVLSRTTLIKTVRDAVSRNYTTLSRDVFQPNLDKLDMRIYRLEGYVRVIDSLSAYLSANEDLLKEENRASLFCADRPILTKVRDDAPARYAPGSKVKNSLVADGCLIAGKVENCILFRGVTVGKEAELKNCVIMQDSVIGDKANLSYVITDKNTVISPARTLIGFDSYPAYIAKDSLV